jgi:steroid 5-alpha reductase family enzyme
MDSIIIFSALVVLVYVSIWFIYAAIRKRNDIADVAWGLGFAVLAWALFLRSDYALDDKRAIALFMITAWALRLAIHIGLRHFSHDSEDGRYQDMRKKWGNLQLLRSYSDVFITQGFFLLLVSTPIILFFYDNSVSLQWYNYLGIAIWAVGLVFEAVGDYQLKQFLSKSSNKGKIMKYGLWQYTRHPNYFGEISLWWGFYLFVLFTPYWYIGIIGPLTITYLILGVSGIPMLEKRYKGNKEYEKYQETTSAFIPLPRKS